MIDLRSDTLTRPTPGMREAMAQVEVGDDVYGEDPALNALQQRVATLLGHEAGLFTPSGSMANLLGVWALVPPGQEVVCDVRAHIARAEMGAHAALHGVTMRTWDSPDGVADPGVVGGIITPNAGPYLVSTAAVSIENTHNFGGGTVQSLEALTGISELCRGAGVKLHLDGARLWNAHVATGVPLDVYGRLFDAVSVCFSKGLGAPVGSMLVGSAELIDRVRVQRKRLGGGMRQAGILAEAAGYALDHQLERLAEDHRAARAFAAEVALAVPSSIDPGAVATNIVVVDTGSRPAAEVAAAAREAGVLLTPVGPRALRAVTHLDVTLDECATAGRLLGTLLERS
jgi:threonine aldolase